MYKSCLTCLFVHFIFAYSYYKVIRFDGKLNINFKIHVYFVLWVCVYFLIQTVCFDRYLMDYIACELDKREEKIKIEMPLVSTLDMCQMQMMNKAHGGCVDCCYNFAGFTISSCK